jgi:hypothetical protein
MSFDVRRFVDGLHSYLGREFGPLFKRVKALEERVAAMEKSVAAFEHKGMWEPGRVYECNNATTQGGGIWICKAVQST